jgi:putative spermidine/putrescine transport system substrate-binding protein
MALKPPDAFLSYTRFDDQNDDGAICQFCVRLANAVRAVTGEPFEIFQDVDGIALGERWQGKLDEMLEQARFFIPIVTPNYFTSEACREELEKFLFAEAKRGRDDLVLPIYYIESEVLEDEERRAADPLAQMIHERQRQDWRQFRFESFDARDVRKALERLAREINRARHRSNQGSPGVTQPTVHQSKQNSEFAAVDEYKHKEWTYAEESSESEEGADVAENSSLSVDNEPLVAPGLKQRRNTEVRSSYADMPRRGGFAQRLFGGPRLRFPLVGTVAIATLLAFVARGFWIYKQANPDELTAEGVDLKVPRTATTENRSSSLKSEIGNRGVSQRSSTATKKLTAVSWGGAYTVSQVKAYYEPWTAKTGIKVITEDPGGSAPARIRSQVESGNVTWNIVDVLEAPAIALCEEGLIEELDMNEVLAPAPDGTPPTEDWLDGLGDCFVPTIVFTTLFVYNNTMFPEGKKPQTIADIFNVEEFPGKRGLEKTPYGNLEWALVADGVPADQVYEVLATPQGLDRAFAKLDTIKNNVVWWEKGAEPPQLLADKKVSISSSYNGRIFDAQVTENQPFVIIWDGQLQEVDGYVIPAGAPDMEATLDLLRFATTTQALADQAKYISYGPARKSSAALVSTHEETGVDMRPHMPTNPENMKTAIAKDAWWWSNNYEAINQRFSGWLVGTGH